MRFSTNFLLASTAVVLTGCASLDRPALKSYDEIRAAIVVTSDPSTGVVTASSESAAKEEVKISDIGVDSIDESGLLGASVNSQRSRKMVFVQADRRPDGATQVYVVSRRNYPISETELQARPWTETDPDRTGLIGDKWREVPLELVEFRYECPGSRLNCTRYATDRLKLSSEDVRVLLQEGREKIRVSFSDSRIGAWLLDTDQLLAVLDALNAMGQFRSPT